MLKIEPKNGTKEVKRKEKKAERERREANLSNIHKSEIASYKITMVSFRLVMDTRYMDDIQYTYVFTIPMESNFIGSLMLGCY